MAITGYCNGDDQTAYLSELGDNTFTAADYLYPSRTGDQSVTHKIVLDNNAKGSLHFRIGGDNQCVWIITLYPETATGITDITVDSKPGNGKTYNMQGMEVKEPLAPGIYIRDGKKFIKKR